MEDQQEKRAKRGNGEGSITLQKDGRWVARIYLGKNAEGKNKIKAIYGHSEPEVKRKLKEYKKEMAKHDMANLSKGTVQTYMTYWLENVKKNELKPTSYDRLEQTLKYQVFPYLGHIQLQAIQFSDVQYMINELQKKGLSYSAIKKAYDAVHGCFAAGMIQHTVLRNPALGVTMPSKTDIGTNDDGELDDEGYSLKFYTPDEVKLLYKAATETYKNGNYKYRLGYIVILDINTGLRIGELLGLRWSDIDFKNRTLTVSINRIRMKNREKNAPKKYLDVDQRATKTKSGQRKMYLNDDAYNALQKIHEITGNEKYVLTTETHKRCGQRNLDRMLRKIAVSAGLEDKQYGFHALRHTFASLLFANGEDVKIVSELLGHSDVQITYNTYIHLIDESKRLTVNKVSDIINSTT